MPRPRRTLPPDPETLNDARARWAAGALEEFISITGVDLEDAVADLLCDLKHWCDRHGVSFNEELHRAKRHYIEETRPIEPTPQPAPYTPTDNEVPF